ncbi:TPA: hypothetical protein ACGUU1_001421 [Vibrio vulnificus]
MLKKTLLALAVASVATSASAMTISLDKSFTDADFEVNVLASQTKQAVLDKTSLEGVLNMTFKNGDSSAPGAVDQDELRSGGEVILTLTNGAQFNPDQVNNLLSKTLAGAGRAETYFSGFQLANAAGAWLPAAGSANGTDSAATLEKLFKITDDGTTATINYTLDENNTRLSLRLADSIHADYEDLAAINTRLDFFATDMKQGFKLISGSTTDIKMTVGALENASYTADPQPTEALFKMDNLFKLSQEATPVNNDGVDATALVSSTYTQWDTVHAKDVGIIRAVKFFNNTTKQNIQHKHIKLSLSGNFDGIATKDGKLADENGAPTSWAIVDGKASVMLGDLTSDGQYVGDAGGTGVALTELPKFYIDADNETSIEAQKFALDVTVVDNATFDTYTQSIGNAFVVVRDGMKFDTVTTGTTSSNVIYIRDVSKSLPVEGGKIFVTITEYAEHANDAKGAGEDVVVRKELTTRLPSNGAVTLTPVGIAADLGVELNPARQARFFFEVETNQGEAAVKKQTADGVDIQTGDKAAPVDFTL